GSSSADVADTGKDNGFSIRCVTDIDGTMQGFSSSDASSMSNGDTKKLVDTRDGQVYTVAKIGNLVWMTRNLAIGCNGSGSTYGDTITSKTLTSSDSNVSSSWSTPTNSLTLGNDYNDPRMACNATYGGYYNYAAVSAGTVTSNQNATNEAESSICPSGWRLPTYSEQASITSSTSVFSPVYSGLYNRGSLSNTGTGGYWWSSTPYPSNSNYRYYLHYNDGSLNTVLNYRSRGLSVRCVRGSA
ncbi:MAG: hypothetical protein IIV74_01450, partial [Alphaproteobacteria bacterium]|nr:hypothetical protein [Alphaproteobacteria bacterium]